jgi:DNA-directed RNA polymerase specialized sigma24 family protein
MQETSSNQELLNAWRQGDQQAAELLVRRYMVRLTAMARSRLSRKLARRLDAEDAVLSAWRSFFVAAGDGRVTVPEDDNLWPLLVTLTLRKLARQAARHTAQRRSVDEEQNFDREQSWQTVLSREPSPDEAALVADELESLMASLDRPDRELLSRRLQGQSVAAIAAATNAAKGPSGGISRGFASGSLVYRVRLTSRSPVLRSRTPSEISRASFKSPPLLRS